MEQILRDFLSPDIVDHVVLPYLDLTEQKKMLIGLFAEDIRGYWGDNVGRRLSCMKGLCSEIGREDLVDWLEENEADIYDDGRHLSNHFELYGGGEPERSEFDPELLAEYEGYFEF